jgi:hypothetical protein
MGKIPSRLMMSAEPKPEKLLICFEFATLDVPGPLGALFFFIGKGLDKCDGSRSC